ncbi:amino acid permease [Burkholderia lata]|uniref:Amino acid permease n=1 Tax=Burkholderia lata (strain ATCC 17760 / DSM 23089 / LMG 22485 / NCIMB 9086 / R18194 / 383) TaxID=482957 RepID=A0A6P2VAJ1_BURL3|nr:APC family permease [Burkholderia lata]VWC76263.1 amino acid permease [Burkholderia lata]
MATSEEAKLKKVLGLKDVLGLAIGLTVGPGVLVLMGPGIGLTGKGVVLAFLISGIANCINVLPMAQLCSAIPTTGAGYRYSSMLLAPRWGFLFQIGIVCSKVTIALFALSFAQYAQGLFPSLPIQWTAFWILTLFYIINLVGLRSASTLQNILVLIKLSGLAVFVFWGVSSVKFSSFASSAELIPNGLQGLLQAVGILAYSSYGAVTIAELGGEMKKPSRDIPIGLVFGTIGVTVLYVLIAFVAAGVLPVADVANKPLTVVAKAFMPHSVYVYFVLAGAIVSITTTLNGVFQWITKGLIVACEDGWLPRRFGAVNSRFGTPHWCLTFFYLLGAGVIVSGVKVVDIARVGFGFLLIVNMIPVIACAMLPTKFPEAYAKAPFHIKPALLYPCIGLALICMSAQIYYLLSGLPHHLLVTECVIVAGALAYVNIVGRRRDHAKRLQAQAQ